MTFREQPAFRHLSYAKPPRILNRNHLIPAHRSVRAGCAPASREARAWRPVVLLAAWSFAVATGHFSAKAGPIHATVLFPQETPLTTVATTQPYLVSVIVADLNGDGLPDVIVGSQGPGMVAWYPNTGGGTFGSRQIVSTALGSPNGLFAADLDGDGLVDIACASFNDSTVAWFKNLGGSTPAFALNVVTTGAYHALSVAASNINAETGLDILSTSANPDNKVAWYRNNPLGTFGPQNVLSTVAASPSSITVSDLDGNGIPDLVVTSGNDNTLAWFQGATPVGGIPQYTRRVIATNQPRAVAAAIADIDGDGWPDVLCATPFVGDAASGVGNRVTWFRNTTHDVGTVAPFFGSGQVITGYAQGAYSVASADLNSDGKPDAVAASLSGSKVTWYENLGGGSFGWNAGSPAANEHLISATSPYFEAISVATADFNQDGTIDVVAGSNGDGNVLAWLNRGGQCALASVNTAPATIGQGVRDDVLRIAVSSRGVAGDNNARLHSLTLLLEKAAGVSMTTAEANALIENLYIYVDSNNSGAFELGLDSLVGTVPDLQLTAGRLAFPLAGANPADVQIAPGATRNYFVVAQPTLNASTQNPSAFRVTHVGQGTGRSVTKDATSGAVLTVEYAANSDAPSSMVGATVSPLQLWRQTWFGTMANSGSAADSANPDGDAGINIVEFAFGTNPTLNQSGAISVNGPAITPGSPTVSVTTTQTGVDFRALYGRRKDYAAAGVSYAVQFSADLATWVTSADTPTVIADNGVMEAVTVPYPLFINGKKAQFFRVVVTGP